MVFVALAGALIILGLLADRGRGGLWLLLALAAGAFSWLLLALLLLSGRLP